MFPKDRVVSLEDDSLSGWVNYKHFLDSSLKFSNLFELYLCSCDGLEHFLEHGLAPILRLLELKITNSWRPCQRKFMALDLWMIEIGAAWSLYTFQIVVSPRTCLRWVSESAWNSNNWMSEAWIILNFLRNFQSVVTFKRLSSLVTLKYFLLFWWGSPLKDFRCWIPYRKCLETLGYSENYRSRIVQDLMFS